MGEMVDRLTKASFDILLVDNDLGAFGKGSELLRQLGKLTCPFNGLAISYSGDRIDHGPAIHKSVRGKEFVQRVQQLWSAFICDKKLANKRILLVDDKDMHVYLETKLLNKFRAVTFRFRDGCELVESVDKINPQCNWPWDAVILDQTMEKLDGLPTLHRLPDKFKAAVPIIVYSTEDSLKEQYLAAGAAVYMEKKPGSHKSVVAQLEELLS
jgi:CheY-like chemotaxis protein